MQTFCSRCALGAASRVEDPSSRESPVNISAECLKAASAEKLEFAAQQHELAKDELECASVVLAKIGDGFEVRRQPAQQRA